MREGIAVSVVSMRVDHHDLLHKSHRWRRTALFLHVSFQRLSSLSSSVLGLLSTRGLCSLTLQLVRQPPNYSHTLIMSQPPAPVSMTQDPANTPSGSSSNI